MREKSKNTFLCPICQIQKSMTEGMHGELIHGPLVDLIRKRNPDWSLHDKICVSCLNDFRAQYVQAILEEEKGELSSLEEDVVKSLREQELLSKNINIEYEKRLTFGEKVADRVAEFGGSWRFIIIFAIIFFFWMAINSMALLLKPFDPYPYIFLNLILSCLAAIQAPIIMMSQNRQETKDRIRAEHDYQINLKAEFEIRHLHAKIDKLLTHQWARLLEIQQIQVELMEELTRKA